MKDLTNLGTDGRADEREGRQQQSRWIDINIPPPASEGATLEENEDEVVDDIDDDACDGCGTGQGLLAVETAFRRSSLIISCSGSTL